MKWKIAQAKARFSEVLNLSQTEPQVICHRSKEIGVIIPFRYYQKMLDANKEQEKPSMKSLLAELKEINKNSTVRLSFPKRKNRRVSILNDHL